MKDPILHPPCSYLTEIKLPGGSIVCEMPRHDKLELNPLRCEVREWLGPPPDWAQEEITSYTGLSRSTPTRMFRTRHPSGCPSMTQERTGFHIWFSKEEGEPTHPCDVIRMLRDDEW